MKLRLWWTINPIARKAEAIAKANNDVVILDKAKKVEVNENAKRYSVMSKELSDSYDAEIRTLQAAIKAKKEAQKTQISLLKNKEILANEKIVSKYENEVLKVQNRIIRLEESKNADENYTKRVTANANSNIRTTDSQIRGKGVRK